VRSRRTDGLLQVNQRSTAESAPRTKAPIAEVEHRRSPLRYYSPVPVALLLDTSISNNAKVLAGLLLHYDGPRGCFPKVETLERDLNVSRHTIYRLVEELERAHFLERRKRGRNNTYLLTPQYVQPTRHGDIRATGELAIENATAPKPVARKTLRKLRPEPTIPRVVKPVKPVAPVRHIDEARQRRSEPDNPESVALVQPMAKHVAPERHEPVAPVQPDMAQSVAPERPIADDTSQRCDMDKSKNQEVTKNHVFIHNQQQQTAAEKNKDRTSIEAALIAEGVAPEDAVPWAVDLLDIDVDDVLAALKIMRVKPAYRRREINRPGAYMRVLVNTQVHVNRQLAEHEARKRRPASQPPAPLASASTTMPRTETIRPAERAAPVGRAPSSSVHDQLAVPEPTSAESRTETIRPTERAATVSRALSPSVDDQLAVLEPASAESVRARALQICKAGSQSPAWTAALTIALHNMGYASKTTASSND
jgi:hypothetical protein